MNQRCFLFDFVPIDCVDKLVPNGIVQRIQIRTVRWPMILSINDGKLSRHHGWVRRGAILLKGPVVTENWIPIFQHNGKHFFDINSMIDCSLIHDNQGCHTLGTVTQPNHYFLWELSHLLYATLSIGISAINCPHSIVLRAIDTINVKILPIGKRILIVSSFGKCVRTQFVNFFLLIFWSSESDGSMTSL